MRCSLAADVCVSVSVSVLCVGHTGELRCGKNAEPIEMPFGLTRHSCQSTKEVWEPCITCGSTLQIHHMNGYVT